MSTLDLFVIKPEKKKVRKEYNSLVNIKFPLSEDERITLRTLAYYDDDYTSLSAYATMLVEEGLRIPYMEDVGCYDYKDMKGYLCNVFVTRELHEAIYMIAIKWNCSLRKATYTLMRFVLETR